VLVIPAIAALTAASYEGRERALAYALLGGVAADRGRRGPADRRLGDDGVPVALRVRRRDRRRDHLCCFAADSAGRPPRARPQLDLVGVALSSSGLGLIVFAILRSSVWGFVKPRTPPTINGTEITPLGFSPVPFLVLGGLALLGAFCRLGAASRPPRPRPAARPDACCGVAQLRAGSRACWGSSSS
jgi:hypothetical protein